MREFANIINTDKDANAKKWDPIEGHIKIGETSGWRHVCELTLSSNSVWAFRIQAPLFCLKIVCLPKIAAWMKNQCLWSDVEIRNTAIFGQQWWDWWLSLQPKSRICGTIGNNTLLPTLRMDWSHLQKSGKNRFLLIMLALVWWG
jgi:hypothetical protein